ncbi:MarR family transcriptional regulator [Intrasporangium chromatireducens Q5-1]|uniref:MarR family transcriptional regulator n=1 Tax=Intrasporangium chromatireducens Q5-1 TaxID=584657 RepID=W9GME0_9MICO|nr:MarR family transcriptional regulator [Intrasporangium chromatireducens]EWT05029.1 MarR family transcriptional regulator [Intrasporangium chromatireducens Q5-1]
MDESARPKRLLDALARAHRVVGRSLQVDLEREEGITLDQWRVLRALSTDEGRTMGELVEHLQVPAASVTRFVDTLVDRALVFRHARAADRRQVEVLLSSLGSQVLARTEALVQAHEARLAEVSMIPVADLIDALESIASATPSTSPAHSP